MQVDLGLAVDVHERRQFVRPRAVVALVVDVEFRRHPSAFAQPRLYRGEPFLRHEQVDVDQRASARVRQSGQRVGAALQHDDRLGQLVAQRVHDAVQIPQRGAPLRFGLG